MSRYGHYNPYILPSSMILIYSIFSIYFFFLCICFNRCFLYFLYCKIFYMVRVLFSRLVIHCIQLCIITVLTFSPSFEVGLTSFNRYVLVDLYLILPIFSLFAVLASHCIDTYNFTDCWLCIFYFEFNVNGE